MDANVPRQKGTPTDKMITAAKAAAIRHDVKLPKDIEKSFDVCKAFLDKYLNKPTPKALAFAEKIAKEKGLTIPDEVKQSGKDLSAWIDSAKS